MQPVRSARSRPLLLPLGPALLAATASGQAGDGPVVQILAPDAAAEDYFGADLAIEGDLIVAATPRDDDAGTDAGSVYLIDRTTGQTLAELYASDAAPDGVFASAVATDGDVVLVGSQVSEKAYLFDVATGQELFKLVPGDAGSGGGESFGFCVALGGGYALVGAPYDGTQGFLAGAAYLFDVATGQELAKLYSVDIDQAHTFGFSVAIRGSTGLVGSQWVDDRGAVYVFDLTTGAQTAKLSATDGAPQDELGFSVDVDGGLLVAGNPNDDDNGSNSGSVYLFDLGTGAQLAKVLADDGANSDGFGYDVAIDGSTLVVGAPGDDDKGSLSGSVYVFDTTDPTQPVLVSKIVTPDGAVLDQLGIAVGISGSSIVATSLRDDDGAPEGGAVYHIGPLPPIGAAYCGPAVPNSSGAPGEIAAQGSDVAGHDYVALEATQLPTKQFGYFLTSMTQGFVANPGGSQGNLCLGGQIARYVKDVASTGPGGKLSLQIDLTKIPPPINSPVFAGETWSFQAWFRDKNPDPTSNFTDGVFITFQ